MISPRPGGNERKTIIVGLASQPINTQVYSHRCPFMLAGTTLKKATELATCVPSRSFFNPIKTGGGDFSPGH